MNDSDYFLQKENWGLGEIFHSIIFIVFDFLVIWIYYLEEK